MDGEGTELVEEAPNRLVPPKVGVEAGPEPPNTGVAAAAKDAPNTLAPSKVGVEAGPDPPNTGVAAAAKDAPNVKDICRRGCFVRVAGS